MLLYICVIMFPQRGELLDLSGSVFSLGEDGSLYIVSPSGEESGEFVCTATNAAGYSSRKVQLTVYGKSPFALLCFTNLLWF